MQHWDEQEEADVVNFLPGWTVVSQRERLSHRVTCVSWVLSAEVPHQYHLTGVISLA